MQETIEQIWDWTAQSIQAWYDAAIADGWKLTDIHCSPDNPSINTYWRLEHFAVFGDQARKDKNDKWIATSTHYNLLTPTSLGQTFVGSIGVWAPDGLVVDVPYIYDFRYMRVEAHRCNYCKLLGKTVRIGFAGRACPEDHALHLTEIEHAGWSK